MLLSEAKHHTTLLLSKTNPGSLSYQDSVLGKNLTLSLFWTTCLWFPLLLVSPLPTSALLAALHSAIYSCRLLLPPLTNFPCFLPSTADLRSRRWAKLLHWDTHSKCNWVTEHFLPKSQKLPSPPSSSLPFWLSCTKKCSLPVIFYLCNC